MGGNVKYRFDEEYLLELTKVDDEHIREIARGVVTQDVTNIYLSNTNKAMTDFGIVGDGIADDTLGFRAYLQSLKESGGGVMFLPGGFKYKITGTIEVPSNVSVIGEGDSTEILLGDGYVLTPKVFRGDVMSYAYLVNETGAKNVHFSNFKVVGNKKQFEDKLHHAVAFIDCEFGSAEDVSAEYINYSPVLAKTAYLLAFNIAVIRSKVIDIKRGRYEYGGYENIGLEFSQDVIIDSVFCGAGWRTSLQIHQGNTNVKVLDCTIRQDHKDSHGALTIHGRGAGGENRDITVDNTSIYSKTALIASWDHVGGLQLLGPTLSGKFTNNTIVSNKNGLYLPDGSTGDYIVTGNNIACETGVALSVKGRAIVDGNFLSSGSGRPYEALEGAEVLLGKNFGIGEPV